MEQLKSCPFCGCDAEVRTGYATTKHDKTKEVPVYVYVRCNRCLCQTTEFMTRNNKNAYGDAIKAWNRRV